LLGLLLGLLLLLRLLLRACCSAAGLLRARCWLLLPG
jgi:hypothetical protein